ncbi:UNVERIFIED_CONTAM: hypothetical protein Sradi_7197500, partial [Sesamum radiatum]
CGAPRRNRMPLLPHAQTLAGKPPRNRVLLHFGIDIFVSSSKILAMGFNEKLIRIWEYYFDYCAAGFKYCILGDYQIVFSRPGDVAAFGNKPYNAVPGDY